ncbi:hypothetical protein CLV59_101361 [Chitinophaga dinghuensis]|uniref:Dolichyl-phosphate-mannose-protein mannosyltransferase n=1 Tax=Chitinophaga dinghuensis TaxID=1539050 RepID=A0A327WDF5_9BACT|nr:hypothetical protein [Chitinophaga dinghuensis]RAJ87601.1 hypothetical protein CLV59_101361 [Chitinophaga dinghuensis]
MFASYRNPKSTEYSFRYFLLADRRNLLLAGVAAVTILLNLIIFKMIYPYADITADSETYITAAMYNVPANIWPIGYSQILRYFHTITASETALVAFQYVCLQCGAFFLYFTILYLLKPGKIFRYGAFLFLLINPLFLYLSNYVITEALFLALGFTWFALLLWMLYKPGLLVFLLHGIVLALVFTIRYNAMFFPIVAAFPLIICRAPLWKKSIAVAFPFLLITGFIIFTMNATYRATGVRKFSVFSSWQLANNAMYMAPYIPYDTVHIPQNCRRINAYTHAFYTSSLFNKDKATPANGAYYMWEDNGPMKALLSYTKQKYGIDDTFSGWAQTAPIFEAYGTYMITHHPWAFARYFWLPNMVEYLRPSPELIENNIRAKHGTPVNMQAWFNGTPATVSNPLPGVQSFIIMKYVMLVIFLQIVFLEELIRYLYLKRHRYARRIFNKVLVVFSVFMIVNFFFSTLAAPVILRYQLMLMVLQLFAVLLLIEKNENNPIPTPKELKEDEAMMGI